MTRLFSRAAVFSVVLSLAFVVARAQQLSTKPLMNITGYVIDVTVIPSTHELHATAKVSFTALDALPVATFELHSGLKVVKVADAKGHPLNAERGQASTLRVTPSQPMAKGDTAEWTFEYDGTLENGDGSPVEGLKLASISDPMVSDDRLPDGPLHRGHHGACADGLHGAGLRIDRRTACGAWRPDVAVQLGPTGFSGNDCCGQVQSSDRCDGRGEHQGVHHTRA
jgi:hypothetical protein